MTPRQMEKMKPKESNIRDIIYGVILFGMIFLVMAIAGASDYGLIKLLNS